MARSDNIEAAASVLHCMLTAWIQIHLSPFKVTGSFFVCILSQERLTVSCCRNKVTIRKMKSGSVKPCFISVLSQKPFADLRIKLLAHKYFDKVHAAASLLTG